MNTLFSFFLLCLGVFGSLHAKLDIDFIVNPQYIAHFALRSRIGENQDLRTFRKEVEEKIGIDKEIIEEMWWASPLQCNRGKIKDYLDKVVKLDSFAPLLQQVKEYRLECRRLWDNAYEKTGAYVSSITNLSFDRKFHIYLSHPAQGNGRYCRGESTKDLHVIVWGSPSRFPNYQVVYMWHEILHSYLPLTDIGHCLVQFISDNCIRILLDENEPALPLVGHEPLAEMMNEIHPKWEAYLQRHTRDILEFYHEIDGTIKSVVDWEGKYGKLKGDT